MILETKNPTQAQIDALLEEWKKDSKLDPVALDKALSVTGSLHSKYMTILSVHRRAFKEANRVFAKLKRIKYEYYSGRLDQEALKKYNWTPFPYTLKGDFATYLESDPDILSAKRILDIHEEIVEICQSIIKELGARTYQLRDLLSWEKFIAGSH